MPDDAQLLEVFARTGSAEAFRALVDRHLDLVYAAARRQVGDVHEAEDVTQAVFMALVRKAGTFRRAALLPAWLLKATYFAASEARRSAVRRRCREQEVGAMMPMTTSPAQDPEWDRLSPHVDAALARLSETDRALLIAHYIRQQSVAEAATGLGLSEPAARKRMQRALGRLRVYLEGQTAAPVLALPALLAGYAVAPAPAGLSTSVAGSVLTSVNGAAGGAIMLVNGNVTIMEKAIMKAFFWAKVRVAAIVTAVLVMLGVGLPTTLHYALAGPAPKIGGDLKPIVAASATEVVARGSSALDAFAQVRRKGIVVVEIGPMRWEYPDNDLTSMMYATPTEGHCDLVVPPEMRFKSVEPRQLIEAIAAAAKRQVVWSREGKLAVIQHGAADRDVEKLQADLKSPDVHVRRDAAWRAGWLWDVRVLEPLVQLTGDADAMTRMLAVRSLGRTGWGGNPKALRAAYEGYRTGLARVSSSYLMRLAIDLGWASDADARPIIQLLLEDEKTRPEAKYVLARALVGHGDPAYVKELLRLATEAIPSAALAAGGGKDPSATRATPPMRVVKGEIDWNVIRQMAYSRQCAAAYLPVLEEALPKTKSGQGQYPDLLEALGNIGGEKARKIIEELLVSSKLEAFREIACAYDALGHMSDARSIELIQEGLATEDTPEVVALIRKGNKTEPALMSSERAAAYRALGWVGGEEVVRLLEDELKSDQGNALVTGGSGACRALGEIGGDKALALLEKTIKENRNEIVSTVAAGMLWRAGGEKALPTIAGLLEENKGSSEDLRNPSAGWRRYGGARKALFESREERILFANAGHLQTPDTYSMLFAVSRLDGKKALELLDQALAAGDGTALDTLVGNIWHRGALSPDRVDGDNELKLMARVLDIDPGRKFKRGVQTPRGEDFCQGALGNIAQTGGEAAEPLMEKGLGHPSMFVRSHAAELLGIVGGDKMLALIDKVFDDKELWTDKTALDNALWMTVLYNLKPGYFPTDNVRAVFLQKMQTIKDVSIQRKIASYMLYNFPDDELKRIIQTLPVEARPDGNPVWRTW